MDTAQRKPAALAGIRVLDLSRVRAGPTAARQLADWGADVISIEMPCALDPGEPHVGARDGADFQNLNRNKRSITLNLKDAAGVAVLHRLTEQADILIENFRPAVKHRLGIDYERMAAINARLVYASISGFGQDGPYRDRPGFDQIAQAMGGLMSVTGSSATGPMRAGIAVADLSAGLFCAFGILVALLERVGSGRGQWVQTSLLEAQAFMLDFQAARWLMEHEVPRREGNDHATIAPCGTFAAADGEVSLAVVGEVMWQRLCHALGRAAWLQRSEYACNEQRRCHRDQLHRDIEQVLGTRSRDAWIAHLNAAGVPCGPVYAIDELFEDPQVRHLELVQELAGDDGRIQRYLGQPVRLTRTPSGISRPTPARGQHTDAVLAQAGYSAAEIAELHTRGIV